ncbi:demethoxyubiquinone hydroxylase family protein [Alteromonas sp. A079]|uniref:demethoxyubiquinone hydroxylase family protein n=1 Tax=Alteromonas sp. A079 TaxID=3410268 RepID=UPI003B9E7F30
MKAGAHVKRDSATQQLDQELRASHAGETGAVFIYRGALAANILMKPFRSNSTYSRLQSFATQHLKTEQSHVAMFENELPHFRGSFLLLFWIVAGFVTGFLPTLLGANWFYYTIYCVERFVDEHYESQCAGLATLGAQYRDVVTTFRQCQQEEQHHRDEALNAMTRPPNKVMKMWGAMVDNGSKVAVSVAKRI